jgi:hypothetical protein
MPKKAAGRKKMPIPRRKRKLARIAVCLILSLVSVGAAFALWGTKRTAPAVSSPAAAPAHVALQSQNSFSPTSPAREYVYAGGRLVATEEPTPLGTPTNLRFVKTISCSAVAGKGYLTWLDNSNDETGFVIEARVKSDGVWGAWSQKETTSANVANSSILTVKAETQYQVKAINASASSLYSNTVTAPLFNACEASCTPPTTLIVSEFRLRGAAGAKDEFVELYNNSDSAITVCTADTSGGWTLDARTASGASSSPVFTVPNGTVIPARGHYLAVNGSQNGYSLSNHPAGSGTTATGDITYTTDIEDDSGIALFKTANPENFTAANRLDAAGFSGAVGAIADLYREGAGRAPVGTQNGQYSFVRKVTSASGYYPQDTANNASDFWFVSTGGGAYNGAQSVLGAPGPENLSSPIRRDSTMPGALLDPAVGSSSPPNRMRDFTSDPGNNSTFGTMSIRRTITNGTGAPVTRLRFRVADITTYPVPAGYADLRPLTSGPVQVTLTNGTMVTVQGTTVEQPPAQPGGGGYNTAMSVALPQPLAPGASVNVQFLLGLQSSGSFRFVVSVEALP